jgi:hypothetical protein
MVRLSAKPIVNVTSGGGEDRIFRSKGVMLALIEIPKPSPG